MKGVGLYGPGMPGFILDEMELGFRVAAVLDEESLELATGMYWWYTVGNPGLEELEKEDGTCTF